MRKHVIQLTRQEMSTATLEFSKFARHLLCFFLIRTPFFLISESSEADRVILLNLKRKWGNPTWARSWNSSSSPCDWPEIRCADNGVVTGLLLPERNITHQIPSDICDFTNLTELDLTFNYLTGNFPTVLYNCSELRYLNLSHNHFTGPLPANIDRMSSSLHFLDLGANNFTDEVPPSMGRFPELRTLYLYQNLLVGAIPVEISKLEGLVDLDLSENQFQGQIPRELGHLRLTHLNLSSNQLNGKIPAEFDNLAYQTSFMNNPKLCASIPMPNLRSCGHNTNSKIIRLAIILVVSDVFLLLIGATLIKLWPRYKRGKRNPSSLVSMIAFQRLSFNIEEIMSALTEDKVIGRGGGGEVYRIPIGSSGERVAVKKIWNNGGSCRRIENQFLSEVRTLGMMKHENIVRLLCCIHGEGSNLLVYEYVENGSLNRWLHGEKNRGSLDHDHGVLDWPKRLKIAIGVAQGLCYMHHDFSPPIVHRDIKSSNILLDSEFNAKIADFGLAKILTNPGVPNTTSVPKGTFGYFAPEYFLTSKVDEKADVYSFGVVLLELVTGRLPIDREKAMNLATWAEDNWTGGTSIADLLDEEVKQPYYLEEMSHVFELGILCTEKSPDCRPSMGQVLVLLGAMQTTKETEKLNRIDRYVSSDIK